MSWNWSEPTSKNFDSLFNPPDLHELDTCEDCHKTDNHDDIEEWAKRGCDLCIDRLEKALEKNEYCLKHHGWYCEERTDGFCHEHGAINGGEDCHQHYLDA